MNLLHRDALLDCYYQHDFIQLFSIVKCDFFILKNFVSSCSLAQITVKYSGLSMPALHPEVLHWQLLILLGKQEHKVTRTQRYHCIVM